MPRRPPEDRVEIAEQGATRARVPARRDRLKRSGIVDLVARGSTGLVLAGDAVTQPGERTPTSLTDEGDSFVGSQAANLKIHRFEDDECPQCRSFQLCGAFDHIVSRWVDRGHGLEQGGGCLKREIGPHPRLGPAQGGERGQGGGGALGSGRLG